MVDGGQVEDPDKIEAADIDSYMDRDNVKDDGPTAKQRTEWMKGRLEAVREEYKRLCMERDEIEGSGRKDLSLNIHTMFNNNYAARKYFVKALRVAGVPTTDRWVAGE